MPEAIDQKGWEELTAWEGSAPSLSTVRAILTDAALPASFRSTVLGLNHDFIKKLLKPASAAVLMEASKSWNNRFANLVSGRFTELLFHRAYSARLAALGLALAETMVKHDWLDYLLTKTDEDFSLGINIKNAGVQFEGAQSWVGLAAADTLPIATYKIFGSTKKAGHMPLVYVYMVDWTLLARLRPAYWASLAEGERKVFILMTSFKGIPRALEDSFIEATVASRLPGLYLAVGYSDDGLAKLPFRIVSGRKAQRIFYTNHDRSPYVYLQKMNTDPNVHISVDGDTQLFADFMDQWLSTPEKRAALLAGLSRTESFAIPNPPV
jgi:hypothetical protein